MNDIIIYHIERKFGRGKRLANLVYRPMIHQLKLVLTINNL